MAGAAGPTAKTPARGERMLAAGGGDRETLEVRGTFSAQTLGIEPQLVQVRLFAEDYYPGRERVYSPPYQLYVLNAEQHAIWLTEQLHKWHRQSLEVRDRELQLHETNKQLRGSVAGRTGRARSPGAASDPGGGANGPTASGCLTWSAPARISSGRRPATRSSGSAIWRNGPTGCRS